MKKIILMLLCFAQYGFAAPFKITGKINLPLRPYLVFFSQHIPGQTQKGDTVRLSPTGSFNYVLEISPGKFLQLRMEVDSLREINLIGYGNSVLKTELLPATKEAKFSGEIARIQHFAEDDVAYWRKIYNAYLKRNPRFEDKEFLHTAAYFTIQDSITNDRISNLNFYFKGTQQQAELAFIKYRTLGFVYSDLYYKQSYPDPPYEKYKFYQDKFKVKSDYTYKYSGLVSFNDPALGDIDSYYRFVNSFLISELYKRRQKNNEQFNWPKLISSGFNLINELSSNRIANQKIKGAFLIFLVEELERNKDSAKAMEMRDQLKLSSIINAKFMMEINNRLVLIITKNKFKKGSPAPDFEFIDTLGNKFSLANFKGKRLIIDVAASWCKPCISGIPNWNKKVEENIDEQTIYVFLSLDNTKEEAMGLFNRHLPKGKLLFAGNGGFKSKFARDYEIVALPNQLVIDKDGKLESYFYN